MRKQWMIFVAAMTALGITACGSGDGIVINGTTAAEAGSDQPEDGSSDSGARETTYGTKIEIVTGETTTAAETAAQSTEQWTEAAEQTEAPTQASRPAETTRAQQPETTAAKTYKVTDVKKTMYATASVRVRASYSTSSDVLAALSNGEKVEVTGQSENGWMRVNYKGNVGYVSKEYLSETAPKTTTTAQNSGTSGTSNSKPSANTQNSKPTTTTGSGTTPGGTAGPTANNTQGNTTGPTANNTQGNTTGPTANNSQGNSAGPTSGGSTGGGSVTGSSSVTGSVTALDPSGVTVQSSNGTSYQLTWGNTSPPPLAPGDQVSISFETTSSGERRVTGVSK